MEHVTFEKELHKGAFGKIVYKDHSILIGEFNSAELIDNNTEISSRKFAKKYPKLITVQFGLRVTMKIYMIATDHNLKILDELNNSLPEIIQKRQRRLHANPPMVNFGGFKMW